MVFYNGLENMQEREVLKLSSLYAKKAEHISLELETLVLNVNVGYNKILMGAMQTIKRLCPVCKRSPETAE